MIFNYIVYTSLLIIVTQLLYIANKLEKITWQEYYVIWGIILYTLFS